jgi:CHAD domain-containing protein
MAKAWEVIGVGSDVPLGRCARLILETRFREMMSYRDGTLLGDDIEQLHSMRVSSRRLRSAMRNFRDCFEQEGLRYHSERMRGIAATLGAVRDLDVRIDWYEALLSDAPAAERPGVRHLIRTARRDRKIARMPLVGLLEQIDTEGYAEHFLAFVWQET